MITYKNKYLETPVIEIVGFESKRSDSPAVIRHFQKSMFINILKNQSKKDFEAFVSDFKIKFYTLKEELGIPIGITKSISSYKTNSIHIRAVTLLEERHGIKFSAGDKIKYIYVCKNPVQFTFENVIAFKDRIPDGYYIDYDKMWNRLAQKKIDSITKILGWEKKMASLFSFTGSNKK